MAFNPASNKSFKSFPPPPAAELNFFEAEVPADDDRDPLPEDDPDIMDSAAFFCAAFMAILASSAALSDAFRSRGLPDCMYVYIYTYSFV
jgi:hypothetical protein